MIHNLHSCISKKKYINEIPSYANIVQVYDEIWKENPNTRFPICWNLGQDNLYSSNEFNENDKIYFENLDIFGGFIRNFVNISKNDECEEAFSAVYCKSTEELLIFSLLAEESRFGGFFIVPGKVTKTNQLTN